MKVIIIDDEPQSHLVLENHLQHFQPALQVIANGTSVSEGLQLITQHQPDLVFLDIELKDGLGFDLIRTIGSPNFLLIFITAHNKYAQQAIRYGALDFLLKPIGREELEEAIERAREKAKTKISDEQIQTMWEAFQQLNQQQAPSKIAISTAEGIIFRRMEDIIRLEADKNYTNFYLVGTKKPILASFNIGSFEDQFENHPHFMKVHRSSIINLHQVDKFVRAEGGYLVMLDGSRVSVSRVYRDELLKRLSNL